MKRTFAMGLALTVSLLAAGSCTSGVDEAVLAALGGECLLDSDCEGALACVFEQCHERCETSADCSNGARCVVGLPTVHVCELDPSATCAKNSDCPGAMVCGPDAACRDACITSADCLADQTCTRDRVCALPSELEGGELPHTLDGGGCLVSSDCEAPERCFDGVCRLECESGADCVSGMCEANVCAPPIPGGPTCIPGHQQTCACETGGAGVALCDAEGLAYGECLGCEPPGKLECYTPTSPDPDVHYALGIPSNPSSSLSAAAILDDGSVIVGGSFDSVTVNGVPVNATGSIDAIVFKLFPDGSTDWIWTYGVPSDIVYVHEVINMSSGDIVAVGTYGSVAPDFGNGTLPPGPGLFLIRFDIDGVVQASKGFTGNFGIGAYAMVIESPDGGIIMASDFSNTTDLGGGVLGAGLTNPSGFVAKLDSSFDHVFSRAWGNASLGQDLVPSVAFTQDGDLVLAGTATGVVDFGLGPTSSSATRVFVAKYSPTGVPIFAETFDGTATGVAGGVYNFGVYSAPNGDLHLGGLYNGSVDFGTGPLAGLGAYEVTLDESGGLIAVEAQPSVYAFSYTPDGNGAIMAGFSQSAAPFDVSTCTVETVGQSWPVLYHRAANGSIDWVRSYQLLAGALAVPRRVRTNAAGRTAVLFHFGGSNTPLSLDIGGTVANGRFVLMTIDP